jgi:hypothetical protein
MTRTTLGSGVHGKDVSGRPYALLFGELYRRGFDASEIARLCELGEGTTRRLIFDEAPVIRRETAFKALRAVTLLPADHWLGALGLEDKDSYRTGRWIA